MRLQEEKEEESSGSGVEYLIPKKLVLTFPPSVESNETVPFPSQPQLVMHDALGRWVTNLGSKMAPWIVTASLSKASGDPNARVMGDVSVPFVNGTSNFTNLAISHNGTGYKLVYNVTYPVNISFSLVHGDITIKERELNFVFSSNITAAYDGVGIAGLPTVTVYDRALGSVVETGWKDRLWFLSAELIPGVNVNASIMGSGIANITDGFASLTNVSIDRPGNDYQLKVSLYTIPASRYVAKFTTPKFNVSKRIFTLVVANQVGDCNETVVCGKQPVVQVRSILPDSIAGNLGYDGTKWYLNVTLCSVNTTNELYGTTFVEIPTLGEVRFTDLYFLEVSANESLCFRVITEPNNDEYVNLTTTSLPFAVKGRNLYLAVEVSPGYANETRIFGQQPIVDVRDAGTLRSAYPLRKSWSITVSLNTTFNGGVLSGNKTVTVVGTRANFTDLSISSYGVGFVLKFESNYGHVVLSSGFNVRFTNDFRPRFTQTSLNAVNISEDAQLHMAILNVTATDDDVGNAGNVLYSISDSTGTFNISATTGEVTLLQSVDREVKDTYTVVIHATDQAPVPFELSSSHTVMVSLLDVNDNSPTFGFASREYFVNENVDVGEVLFTLVATDADIGVNGEVVYFIISSNDTNMLFTLVSGNGSFITNSSLDLDLSDTEEPSYTFNVSASDLGTTVQYSSYALVRVTIRRVNEFAPVFTESNSTISIKEDVGVGTLVYQVHATDDDSGLDGSIVYSINDESKFAITSDGNVTINSQLDRETTSQYTLIITATDQSTTAPKSSSISLVVIVLDVNDNIPTFGFSFREYFFDETVVEGALLLTLVATDADVGNNSALVYSVVSSNDTNVMFKFIPSNGSFLANGSFDLDMSEDKEPSFVFNISVSDQGEDVQHSSDVIIQLTIRRVNEYAPSFSTLSVALSVKEDIGIGTLVYKVSASDEDSGSDGKIKYIIEAGNGDGKFSVSRDGNLTINSSLDREAETNYALTVTATDESSNPKSSSIAVLISVLDVNDNSPVFSSTCDVYVSDDASVFSDVLTATASDADTGTNAELTYRLGNTNSYFNEYFSYNKLTKTVIIIRQLDMQNLTKKVVNFTIFVEDIGTPPRNTSLDCSVTITGINKHAPVLGHNFIVNVRIPSTATVGHSVVKINASDADSGPDGEITFKITNEYFLNVFAITDTGEVKVLGALEGGCYFSEIRIYDKASVPKRRYTTCYVQVYVLGKTCGMNGSIYTTLTNKVITAVQNETITVPIYAQIGQVDLEGVDVTIGYPSNVYLAGGTSHFSTYHLSNTVRVVGLVAPPYHQQFGIIKIAEFNFTCTSSGVINLTIQDAFMFNQEGADVSLTAQQQPTQKPCSTAIFGDVTADCKLSIADAAFCQSYNRERRRGFASSYASTFTTITTTQKRSLDANFNGDYGDNDCSYILSVFLGRSIALKQVRIQLPEEQTKQCNFTLSVTIDSTVPVPTLPSDVFVAITYNDSVADDSPLLLSSDDKVASFQVGTVHKKYGHVLKLTKSGSTFTLGANVKRITSQLGVTLIIVSRDVTENSYYVTEMFGTNSSPVEEISLPNGILKLSNDFSAQNNVLLNLTTYYCENARVTLQASLTFDVDYNDVVKGREDDFTREFALFYVNYELTTHNRTIEVRHVTVRAGSVIIDFEILVMSVHRDDLLTNLISAVRDGDFVFTYQSTVLTPRPTLVIGGVEQISQTAKSSQNKNAEIIAPVVVVLVLIIIAVGIGIYVWRKKKMKQWKVPSKVGIEEGSTDVVTSSSSYSKKTVAAADDTGVSNTYAYDNTIFHAEKSTQQGSKGINVDENAVVNPEYDVPSNLTLDLEKCDLTFAEKLGDVTIAEENEVVELVEHERRVDFDSSSGSSSSSQNSSSQIIEMVPLPQSRVQLALSNKSIEQVKKEEETNLSAPVYEEIKRTPTPAEMVVSETSGSKVSLVDDTGKLKPEHNTFVLPGAIASENSISANMLKFENSVQPLDVLEPGRPRTSFNHHQYEHYVAQSHSSTTFDRPLTAKASIVTEYLNYIPNTEAPDGSINRLHSSEDVLPTACADDATGDVGDFEDGPLVFQEFSPDGVPVGSLEDDFTYCDDNTEPPIPNAESNPPERVIAFVKPVEAVDPFATIDGSGKNYQMLEVKQLRDKNQSILHYMGVVNVDINGTLEEARESLILGESCFVTNLRFLFLTKNLKLIHPKKENSLIVKNIQKKSIYLKILHGTDGHSMFCPCGRVAVSQCDVCKDHGYCSDKCKQIGTAEKICVRKEKMNSKSTK